METGSSPAPPPSKFLGSWYILAAASGEKDFAVERAVRSVEGVLVSLTPQNHLRVLSSRHRWVRPAGPRWAPEPLVPSALGMASGVCVPGLPGALARTHLLHSGRHHRKPWVSLPGTPASGRRLFLARVPQSGYLRGGHAVVSKAAALSEKEPPNRSSHMLGQAARCQ